MWLQEYQTRVYRCDNATGYTTGAPDSYLALNVYNRSMMA